jgi:hypothetical protein
MRKVSVARCAFVVLTLSMLAGCGEDKKVTDKEHGFEITYPETWVVKAESADESACGTTNPEGANYYALVNVKVRKLSDGTDLKSFFEREFEPNKQKPFETVESASVKFGANDARKVVIEWDGKKKVRYRNEAYFLVSGNRGYIIGVSTLKNDWEKSAKDIDAIVKSFKLIETK